MTLVILASLAFWALMVDVMAARKAQDGSTIPGLNADALWLSATRAWPTLAFWIVCFLLVDRYKPQKLLVWFLALAWGGCVAVMASYTINNWVAERMAIIDNVSGTLAVRLAVFVAPFVEEATKASIIFIIVLMINTRMTVV